MKGKLVVSLFFVLVTLIGHAQVPLRSLADRFENSLRTAEPDWQCIKGILNAPPPPEPSQRPLLVMDCKHHGTTHQKDSVGIHIFQVDSPAAAQIALSPVREGKVTAGWKAKPYLIGDEGYLSTFRANEAFQIQFRSGAIVVKVSSDSLRVAREFADLIMNQIAPR